MEDEVARNWAIFVSGYTEAVGPAFTRATELLQQMAPDEELPFVVEQRLNALKLPLPPYFDGTPFRTPLQQMVKQIRHDLLVAQSALVPTDPATMEDMTVPSDATPPQLSPPDPTAQQLANTLAAMAASYALNYAAAVALLSATLAVNNLDLLTVSAADSPVKFVILEATKSKEIYVAFPGTECWADVASDAAFQSKPTPTGRYHHGFFERASLFPSTGLAEKVAAGAELFLVGHSLGGAVASVVTIEMLARHSSIARERVRCITAGSPLVGDSGVRKRCEQLGITDNLFHMVEPGDAVPRLLSFIGATKNFANGRSVELRRAVQQIAREFCRLVAPEIATVVGDLAGVAVEAMAKLFFELTVNSFEPVGKYCLLPDQEGEPCRWQPASECGLEAPSSYEEVVSLMQNFRHHELDRYRQTVLATLSGKLTNRRFIPELVSGVSHWRASVEHCNISLSNGRLACDVTGERLSLTRSILVGRQRFNVTPSSLVSSTKVAVEIDHAEAQPFEAAVAPVSVVSLADGCSFAGNLSIGVSEVPLQEHGDYVARLDVSQLLVRLFRTHLFRPAGTQAAVPIAGTDPLECLEALVGCQPIEVLYRFLAGREPLAVQETFNIFGRLSDSEQLARLGVSLGALACLQEGCTKRNQLMGKRKVTAEAGRTTVSAAQSASASAESTIAAVMTAVEASGSGTVARWLQGSAKKARGLNSDGSAGPGQAVGDTTSDMAADADVSWTFDGLCETLKAANLATGYSLPPLAMATAAWETYAFYNASQVTREGSSFGDVHQEIVNAFVAARTGHSWEVFDADLVRGIGTADKLVAIIDSSTDVLRVISASKTLAELFPDDRGLVLQAKRTLLLQQREINACQAVLLDAANRGMSERQGTHRAAERSYAKMMDIHTYWTNFITAALSGKTDVAFARHGAASAAWVAKLVLVDNILQPWVPLLKMGLRGTHTTAQEMLQKLRGANSYVMDSCSFDARVDLFYEGIVGCVAEEHIFAGKELYSKLCAIRKRAPHGVTWRTKPIDVSRAWDSIMSEPGIVADSALACITKDSHFEVACWLVSCLCVAELYDACMATYAVALMGVTSTGKSSLIRSIAVNQDKVNAGGLAKHRTSVPLMHECRPFAEDQRPFSVLDMPGHTDRENKVNVGEDSEGGAAGEDEFLPGEEYLPMTNTCSALVATLPHRLSYVKPFCSQLQLLMGKGRLAETGAVKVFITKCEDVIEEALKEPDAAAAAAIVRDQLKEEVQRMGMPGIMDMANTHFAVILNPRECRSEDLQRLGVWELTDIHKWMSDQCNR